MADNWYKCGLEECNRRTGIDILTLDTLRSKSEDYLLSTITSCLSIGAGTGDIDVPLLASHSPQLTSYIGIEPNLEEAEVLRNRLTAEVNTDLKVEIVTETVESWSGPESPVDFILMAHVLYHIPDPQALYRRCVDWLAPGGIMVIVHGGENVFLTVAHKFDVADEKYVAKHILEDLDVIGLNGVRDRLLPVEFDIRDRNVDAMNFMLQRRATAEELTLLDAYLTEILPTGVEISNLHIISWTKPVVD